MCYLAVMWIFSLIEVSTALFSLLRYMKAMTFLLTSISQVLTEHGIPTMIPIGVK